MSKSKIKPLNTDMDAKRWAKEFCKITKFEDEEWAHAWFANAIMCGWDNHYWTTDEYKDSISRILGDKDD